MLSLTKTHGASMLLGLLLMAAGNHRAPLVDARSSSSSSPSRSLFSLRRSSPVDAKQTRESHDEASQLWGDDSFANTEASSQMPEQFQPRRWRARLGSIAANRARPNPEQEEEEQTDEPAVSEQQQEWRQRKRIFGRDRSWKSTPADAASTTNSTTTANTSPAQTLAETPTTPTAPAKSRATPSTGKSTAASASIADEPTSSVPIPAAIFAATRCTGLLKTCLTTVSNSVTAGFRYCAHHGSNFCRALFPYLFGSAESPQELISRIFKVTQLGLLLYIAVQFTLECRDAMGEVVDALREETRDTAMLQGIFFTPSSSFEDDLLISSTNLPQLLDYLRALMSRRSSSSSNQRSGSTGRIASHRKPVRSPNARKVPPMATKLALKLMKSGVPLTSPQPSSSSFARPTPISIESIFQRLTMPQAALLDSMLVVHDPNDSFANIRGLHHVKSLLLSWLLQHRLARRFMSQANAAKLDDGKARLRNSNNAGNQSQQKGRLIHNLLSSMPGSFPVEAATAPQGIMLYGPPGCGKSLMLRALSAELPPRVVLTLKPSVLQRRWHDETIHAVRTMFRLISHTLDNDCVLIIDEIDAMFRDRYSGHDIGYTENDKAKDFRSEFYQGWDAATISPPPRSGGQGITSAAGAGESQRNQGQQASSTRPRNGLIVIGATNRPFDVDTSVHRRLAWSFYMGLPNYSERRELLQHWCGSLHRSVSPQLLEEMVRRTHGYSPSDMFRLLNLACFISVMSQVNAQQQASATAQSSASGHQSSNHWKSFVKSTGMPALEMRDFVRARYQVPPTRLPNTYSQSLYSFMQAGDQTPVSYYRQGLRSMDDDDDRNVESWDGSVPPKSSVPQSQQPVLRWETDMGDFYHLGQATADFFHTADSDDDDTGDVTWNGTGASAHARPHFHQDRYGMDIDDTDAFDSDCETDDDFRSNYSDDDTDSDFDTDVDSDWMDD